MSDDEAYKVVFGEHGASTFQMAAAESFVTLTRLSRMSGQAIDSGPVYSQVRMQKSEKLASQPNAIILEQH